MSWYPATGYPFRDLYETREFYGAGWVPHEGATHRGGHVGDERKPDKDADGQVSEVSSLADPSDPISPEDATAGYPASESGDADEGTAGPNAAPRHDPPEPGNESSR